MKIIKEIVSIQADQSAVPEDFRDFYARKTGLPRGQWYEVGEEITHTFDRVISLLVNYIELRLDK